MQRRRRAEDVRVILRKAADTHQPMQRAGKLSSVTRAQFCVTQRQVTVRMLRGLVDANMARTIHRLKSEFRALEFHRRKHRVSVVLFVSTNRPKLALGYVRRKNLPVASLSQLFTNVVFHFATNGSALRMPEDETLAVLFLNREQVQFPTKLAMVASLRFF